MKSLERVLWISDYFPRPHDPTTGVWALETIFAIQKRGVEVVVLSPTPWIPRWLALTSTLREWSRVPTEFKIIDLPVFYPKCPHYPHHLVVKYLYNFIPFFESSLIWRWCKGTISQIIDRYPFQAIHSNFIFPSGFIGLGIKKRYGIPLIVHERSMTRLTMAENHPIRRNVYAQVIREADGVITVSQKMANLIKVVVPDRKEVDIIRDAGDIETADNSMPQNPEGYQGKKIILSVGALIGRKGHEYLIRAINYIKDEFPD
ncbi:MAG: glycosyltransferase, partial [Thermodesulfobacteriota bacterium]